MTSTVRKRQSWLPQGCRTMHSMQPERCSRATCPPMSRALPRSARPTAACGRSSAIAAVLAWEFFAPDPDDMQYSDEELLRETVRFVTQNADFQNARAAFNDF